MAEAAAIYGLITGTIEVIRTAIDIYKAVQDKSGIPERLRKVSGELAPLEGLLRNAQDQYDSKQLGQNIWDDTEGELKRCNELCTELRDLLLTVYPKEEASKPGRFWKNTKTVLSGKGKTAEQLLKEIWMLLDIFAKKGIVTNTALLEEIKQVVDELFSGSSNTFNHYGQGDQVAGDKFTGHKIQQGNVSGRQIFGGSFGTYNEGTQGT